MRKIDLIRKKNRQRIHISDRQTNCIKLSMANSFNHEWEKFNICYNLQNAGHKFYTECRTKDLKRRYDIFDLDTGIPYEIETDIKRVKKDAKTILIGK